MIKTSIYKDIVNDYQEKVIGGLSIRKLVACGVAFPLGIAIGAALTYIWQLDIQIVGYIVVALTVPIWYLGFMRPHDMDPEKFAALWIQDRFGTNKLTYRSHASEIYEAYGYKPQPTKAQVKAAKKEREYLGR